MSVELHGDLDLSPFVLPLKVHPDAPHIILDEDGDQVADCLNPMMYALPVIQKHAARMRQESEERAAHLVLLANSEPDILDVLTRLLETPDDHQARVDGRALLLKLGAEL